MRGHRGTLRTRLTVSAMASAAITLTLLVAAFNVLLDARLRADRDDVLRERAATVLRSLGTVDGRLSVLEAPDQGAIDAQTWIFAGRRTLEQPVGGSSRDQAAARALSQAAPGFMDVDATDTRLQAVAVRQGSQRLGTVVVGVSLTPYESTASAALLGSVILGVLTLAAVGALSLWLVSRALRPVARMTAEAAEWGEHDPARRFFAGEPYDELSSLASVFDGMLARMAQSLGREQRLTAEVSHELRTPLAKILAEAELTASRDRSEHEYRVSLKRIQSHAKDLQRVLETLLASARAGLSTRRGASDALASAERAVAPLHEILATQGKTIELVCETPQRVAVEAEILERILSPLLENAARHARRRVVVEIRRLDGEVLFEVRDDGPGVAHSDRERIFDPGFSVNEQPSNGHLGAGLGLPLARRLAGSAGGQVEAGASDEGGLFTVRVPCG